MKIFRWGSLCSHFLHGEQEIFLSIFLPPPHHVPILYSKINPAIETVSMALGVLMS
jgi:hypothetical protein